ncbi:GNAT family N-acetyltransferase [Alkaliphilus serpentinus]|uniref:GNAT family N-acetyltransferase n=1 Tax=Alkaliphilus serpentinus TaxID=1482731 RepID=A0A833HPB5_9FIRM|nr:GNAT family N-acetyltransferase [Alkaliphilus serpentinus]KAB3530524.1 GNAT family N-acetyltransferase [Alkaliphilus serpentinus]
MSHRDVFKRAEGMKYKFLFHSQEHGDEFFNNSKNIIIDDEEVLLFLEVDESINVYWAGSSFKTIADAFGKLEERLPKGTTVKINAGEDQYTKGLAVETINSFTKVGCELEFHRMGMRTQNLEGVNADTSGLEEASLEDSKAIFRIIATALGDEKFGMDAEEFKEYIQKEGNHVFIIKSASEIAGIVFASIYKSRDRKTVFIRGLAVDEAHRGKGYSKSLLYKAFQWAKENGATDSMLWVEKDNDVAINLYEKFGYSPYGDEELIFTYTI